MISDYFNKNIFGLSKEKNNIELLNGILDRKVNTIMISGYVNVGKTTIARAIANTFDGIVFYIDADNSITSNTSVKDDVYLLKTNSFNIILNTISRMEKGYIGLVVIDSIANILIEDEIDRAKEFHTYMIKIIDECRKIGAQLIFVNQLNSNVNKPYGLSYQLDRVIEADIRISKNSMEYGKITMKNIKNEKSSGGITYEM